jgi:hypothetical protein
MNLFSLARKAVSACVLTAIVTTSSMVVLGSPGLVAGELTVLGRDANGGVPMVIVNGEPAKSGRSIFSSTTVSTPNEASAVISIGKTGRLEMDPGSSMSLFFDEDSVDAELTSGRLTVAGTLGTVKVRTNDGKTTILQSGESITAAGQPNKARQTGGGSEYWWVWLLVAGGAAAAVVAAVAISNNEDPVVSPNR